MALVSFATVDRSTLRWLRSGSTPPEYTLSAGDQPVATLRWPPSGTTPIEVETADGTWRLERAGFLAPRLTARAVPQGAVLAHAEHHVIHLANGATFRIARAGLLVPAWKVRGVDQAEVAHVEPVAEGKSLAAGAVLVPPKATELDGLLVLLVLVWYFISLMWFEDEAVETLTT